MSTFQKYRGNPVFGNEDIGTVFDAYVWRDGGRYRMDFSWRRMKACAVAFSNDGISWSEPVMTLQKNPESGWENDINRNCVLKIGDVYKMWYTGQADGHSYIGYAESSDGICFSRPLREPVLVSEFPWEGVSVMDPCVLFENGIYRMWYSTGENYEPNMNAYAESADGIVWKKSWVNPVLTREKKNVYEQDRVGGCQVIHTDDMGYLMFYIGYRDIDTACICLARSDNGITRWERSPLNPLIDSTPDAWDADACYKPTVLWNEAENKWMLWYNGRKKHTEFIGYAEFHGRNLF